MLNVNPPVSVIEEGGWLTAPEALARLGTRAQTLYANVSRGRIQARPDPRDARRSLYRAADVARVAARRAGRRRNEAVAAQAIAWGEPVLASGVSTIVQGRLRYRGRDAVQWAYDGATLEETAALLWEMPPEEVMRALRQAREARHGQDEAPPGADHAATSTAGPLERAVQVLGRAATQPAMAATPLREAAAVLAALSEALLGDSAADGNITAALRWQRLHQRVAAAWGCARDAELIRVALVLLAEHELNASTFAARVAASTGAGLPAAALCGLLTLTGPLHGGAAAALHELLPRARRGAEAAVRAHLALPAPLPCFGHPLYPQGDVRALALLALCPAPPLYGRIRAAALRLAGEHPNIDFALAALSAARGWPAQAPLTLFALARSTGWLAHALEQRGTGALIRPRARYAGAGGVAESG